MGFVEAAVSRALERRSDGIVTSGAKPAQWLKDALGLGRSYSGKSVSPRTAEQLGAVYACVEIIADTIATLPLIVYERLDPRGKRRAQEHPQYRRLHDRPNPEMSSTNLRSVLAGHQALWGNAYAELELSNAGDVIGYWPLLPDRTRPIRRGGRKYLVVDLPNGGQGVLPPDRFLHIPGRGYDGLMGYSPIQLAKNTIENAAAVEEYAGRFWGQASRPSGVLKTDKKLGKETRDALRSQWEELTSGLSNAHRTAVLEEGLSWQAIGIEPEHAQFLETRKYDVEQIARLWRIPLVLLGHTEKATSWGTSIEQFMIGFVRHTIQPWVVRWEQELNTAAFTERDQGRYYAEFLLDALLRGDLKSRWDAWAIALQNGGMNRNEVREIENMNAIEGEGGDAYTVQLNMAPLEDVAAGRVAHIVAAPSAGPFLRAFAGASMAPSVPPLARSLAARRRLRGQFVQLFGQTFGRIVRRETAAIRRAVKRGADPAELLAAVREFYDLEAAHSSFVREEYGRALRPYGELIAAEIGEELAGSGRLDVDVFVGRYVLRFARRHCVRSAAQIERLAARGGDLAAELEQRLGLWDSSRAEKLATEEAHHAGGAIARRAYASRGAQFVAWSSADCGRCAALAGRIVRVREPFLRPGEAIDLGGGERFTAHRAIFHPPLHHGGCGADIVAHSGEAP